MDRAVVAFGGFTLLFSRGRGYQNKEADTGEKSQDAEEEKGEEACPFWPGTFLHWIDLIYSF